MCKSPSLESNLKHVLMAMMIYIIDNVMLEERRPYRMNFEET
jgi:hypothetical protein